MKNYIESGDTVTVPAPYAVASGDGALVGSIFGAAVTSAGSGEDVPLKTTGILTLKKTSAQAWTLGAPIYWDNAAKEATTASASGANKLIGVAMEAASNPSATGKVRLNGAFIS